MTYFAPVVLRLGSSRSGEGGRGCVGRVIIDLLYSMSGETRQVVCCSTTYMCIR